LILVVVEAAEADRVSEGLRAGIGLGLRGDDVVVVLSGAAAGFASGGDDARIARAIRTLAELRRPVRVASDVELAGLIERARAVEIWSSARPAGPRRLRVGDREIEVGGEPRFRSGGRAIDAGEVVAQILGSDGPVVVR
jgi:hypothetical protein